MAAINITNVRVLSNTAMFSESFNFEITFECLSEITGDIEWKIIYIGSSEDSKYDQTLDTVVLGPLQPGAMRFVFEAAAPDWLKIPKEELIGITAIILTCSYRDQEFFRIGYYVNNLYNDPELMENLPSEPCIEKIQRTILTDKPRISRFHINWEDSNSTS